MVQPDNSNATPMQNGTSGGSRPASRRGEPAEADLERAAGRNQLPLGKRTTLAVAIREPPSIRKASPNRTLFSMST